MLRDISIAFRGRLIFTEAEPLDGEDNPSAERPHNGDGLFRLNLLPQAS